MEERKHPLQSRAEAILPETVGNVNSGKTAFHKFKSPLDRASKKSARELIQELQLHQIELEMQNEKHSSTQLELEESRNKYADLYDFAPVGYFTLNGKGIIVEANLNGAALLGVERNHLINRPFSRYIANDDRAAFYSYRRQLLESQTRQSREVRMLRNDGTQFFAQLESITVFNSLPEPGSDVPGKAEGLTAGSREKFCHFRVALLDITRRKQVEEALRESEEQYRTLVENIPTGIYRTTPDGRILKTNPALAKMLKYSSSEELALRNLEREGFYADYSREQFKTVLEREGEVRGLECGWIRRDGSVVIVRENAKAIRGEDGTVLYYEGTVEDITRIKQAEEAVRENLEQLERKNRYERIISTVTGSVHQSINLQDVLVNAVEAMSQNIGGAEFVSIYLVEEREAVLKAYRGFPDWFIERVGRIPYPKGATWKAIMDGKPIYCADVDKDAIIGAAGREVGTKSYLCMPISFKGNAVGCLNINSSVKNAFDMEELKLLEIVAQQIETAINNARQADALQKAREGLEVRVLERTKELAETNEELGKEIAERKRVEEALRESLAQLSKRNRYEKIISTVTRSVHKSIDLNEVLENAADALSRNLDRADIVGIYFVEGADAVLKAQRGYSDNYLKRASRIPYPKGYTWKTIIGGKPIYCPDAGQDSVIGRAGRETGTESYLSMPIKFAVRTVGSLCINSFKKNAFEEEELKLLEVVAQQIETAINNAKRAEALRESEERFRALYEDNPSIYYTIDKDGKILSVNRFGTEQLGYSADELVGLPVFDVLYKDDKKSALEHIKVCLNNPGHIAYGEFRKVRKDGSVLWVRESARAVRDVDGNIVILLVCEDITKRKMNEEQIKTSLKEKEVLLQEVQHRVKNNLQVISSLLDLQTEYFKDERSIDMLNETQNRVKSMALVHEQLHQSKNLSRIDFAEYIRNLGDYLFQSYGVKSNEVTLNVRASNALLDVDTAITCGLIINELVSNSLKHAFPGDRKGEILISLISENSGKRVKKGPIYTLVVRDNGVGFPKHLDFKKTESLGLQLVDGLIKQLQGALRFSGSPGTAFKIVFSS